MKSILRASLVCVVFAGSAVALSGERMAPIALDYYDVVSMTLNVARVAPPAGEAIPFKQAGL